jgi:hypothetical protein
MQENRSIFFLFTTLLSISAFLFIGFVFGVLSGCSECSEESRHANVSQKSVIKKRYTVELPEIDDLITTQRALKLCALYGFDHLVERIEENPELFKEWRFDGCSMTPDAVLSKLLKVPSLTEICLRHDLGYAYGDPGNEKERLKVDRIFQNELLNAGAGEFTAIAMFEAVRAGGREELCLSFSWSFARVEPCEPGLGLKLKKDENEISSMNTTANSHDKTAVNDPSASQF